MKRILLINPQQNQEPKKSIPMYPSGALLLIGTMCKEQGHAVKIFDGSAGDEYISDVIFYFKPDVVGITVNTFQVKYTKNYLNFIKTINRKITTVIGGPHVSAIGVQSLIEFKNADIAVMGEGEFTFLDIVNDVPLEDIQGICYNGVRNPNRPPIEPLDYIPLPDLSLVDLSKYSGTAGKMTKSMFIMASRGCPFQCIYCNKSIFGSRVRYRKPEKIIEEIRWLNSKYGINHIYFQDDTFNLNREWINEILNLIIKHGLNKHIAYMAPFRADHRLIDIDLLHLAKEANFQNIFYGVESGNQGMLDRMKKGLNVDAIERAFRLTHAVGIQTTAAFIVGLPGETTETIRDSFELYKKLNPTYAGFTLATPFPHTPFESNAKESGHIFNSNYNEYRCGGSYVVTDELNVDELEYYSNIATYGTNHKWVYKLPIFTVAKSKMLRDLFLKASKIYRWYHN